MATYVTLFNFTEQGLRNVKDTVKRMEAANQAGSEIGARPKEFVWTQGQYDTIAISEAADETAAAASVLNILKGGNVRDRQTDKSSLRLLTLPRP